MASAARGTERCLDPYRGHLLLMGRFDMLQSHDPLTLEKQFEYDYGAADERSLGKKEKMGGLSIAALFVDESSCETAASEGPSPSSQTDDAVPEPQFCLPPVSLLTCLQELPEKFALHKDVFSSRSGDRQPSRQLLSPSPMKSTMRPSSQRDGRWFYVTKLAVATSSDGSEARWDPGRVEGDAINVRPLVAIGTQSFTFSLWDPGRARMLQVFEAPNMTLAAKFARIRSSGLQVFFAGGYGSYDVRALDIGKASAEAMGTLPAQVGGGPISGLTFDPTIDALMGVTTGMKFLCWDVTAGQLVSNFRISETGLSVRAIPDKNLVLCGMRRYLAAFDTRKLSSGSHSFPGAPSAPLHVFAFSIKGTGSQVVRVAENAFAVCSGKSVHTFDALGKMSEHSVTSGEISDMVCLPPESIRAVAVSVPDDMPQRLEFILQLYEQMRWPHCKAARLVVPLSFLQ